MQMLQHVHYFPFCCCLFFYEQIKTYRAYIWKVIYSVMAVNPSIACDSPLEDDVFVAALCREPAFNLSSRRSPRVCPLRRSCPSMDNVVCNVASSALSSPDAKRKTTRPTVVFQSLSLNLDERWTIFRVLKFSIGQCWYLDCVLKGTLCDVSDLIKHHDLYQQRFLNGNENSKQFVPWPACLIKRGQLFRLI